jgi:hypothetical protein
MNSLWDILSVAIGVSFVFLILSLLNSWVQEYIATLFSLRANNLADILQNMLEPDADKLNGKDRVYTPFPDSDDRAKKLIEKNFVLRFLREKFGGRVERFTANAVTRFGVKSITQYGGRNWGLTRYELFTNIPLSIPFRNPVPCLLTYRVATLP